MIGQFQAMLAVHFTSTPHRRHMIFISNRRYKPGMKTDRSNTHSEVAAPLHIHHAHLFVAYGSTTRLSHVDSSWSTITTRTAPLLTHHVQSRALYGCRTRLSDVDLAEVQQYLHHFIRTTLSSLHGMGVEPELPHCGGSWRKTIISIPKVQLGFIDQSAFCFISD
jgi:hypothetical protein